MRNTSDLKYLGVEGRLIQYNVSVASLVLFHGGEFYAACNFDLFSYCIDWSEYCGPEDFDEGSDSSLK